MFGPALRLLWPAAKMLLDRLLLIQGFFPSRHSPSIRTVLCKDPKSGFSTLRLSPLMNERTMPTLKRVVQKLWRNRDYLRAVPISPMLRLGKPGRSFHSGGTFPMRASPNRFESDLYGRPFGFQRVHAVDSTVFPSIPATTITLSVMANAHRIGSAMGQA